jgi:hypothetical protein
LVQQIQIGEAQILVWLNRTAIVSSVMPDVPPKPTDSVEPFVLSITASVRRAGKGVRLVIGNGAAKAIDDGLASLIARAIATRNMFLAGRDDSIDAMASRLGVRRNYVAVLVRLSCIFRKSREFRPETVSLGPAADWPSQMWGPSAAFFFDGGNGPTVWPRLDGGVANLTNANGSACRRNQQPRRVPRNTFRADLLEEGTLGAPSPPSDV